MLSKAPPLAIPAMISRISFAPRNSSPTPCWPCALINDVGTEMAQFKDLKNVPNERVRNFRNDMYLTSEALRIMQKSGKPAISSADTAMLKNYKGHIDKAT